MPKPGETKYPPLLRRIVEVAFKSWELVACGKSFRRVASKAKSGAVDIEV